MIKRPRLGGSLDEAQVQPWKRTGRTDGRVETGGGPGLSRAMLARGSCCPSPHPEPLVTEGGGRGGAPGHGATDCPAAAARGTSGPPSAAAPRAGARQDLRGAVGGVLMSWSFALSMWTRDGAAGAPPGAPRSAHPRWSRRSHGRAGSSVPGRSRAAWSGHTHQPFTVRG